MMVKCPGCKKEVTKPSKEWMYGKYNAQAYECTHCGTKFREYSKEGKHSFTLKQVKGNGFVKA